VGDVLVTTCNAIWAVGGVKRLPNGTLTYATWHWLGERDDLSVINVTVLGHCRMVRRYEKVCGKEKLDFGGCAYATCVLTERSEVCFTR
jgi:hypothetical protein